MRLASIPVLATLVGASALTAQQPARTARPDTIVRVADRPVHSGVATLKPEISIGVADGNEHYMIGEITDIAVGRAGAIYIYDRSIPAIRMYDSAGTYVKTIGRRGRGPGEYQAGSALAVARDGNLLMWDPGNARINVYSATGDVLTPWPTLSGNTNETSFGRNLLTVDSAGLIVISRRVFNRERLQQGLPPTRAVWIRFTPSGALKDTLEAPAMPENNAVLSARNGGSYTSSQVPFSPENHFAISPAGLFVTGVTDRYAFELIEAGKPVVSIRRNVQLQPSSAAERDVRRAQITEQMRRTDPTWSWSGPDIPKTKPPYTGIRVGLDGRVWLTVAQGPRPDSAERAANAPMSRMGAGRAGPSGGSAGYSCTPGAAITYDVFEPTGVYLGQVQVPVRSTMMLMRGDFVWASACDEDDIPSVKRYKILWR